MLIPYTFQREFTFSTLSGCRPAGMFGTVALMMQIAAIRQIELATMIALALSRTLHRQTQEFELPLLQAPVPEVKEK